MIFCTSCGTQNIDGVKFCVNCGATLTPTAPSPGGWRDSSETPPTPEADRPAVSYSTPPPTAYPTYTPGAPGDPGGFGGAGSASAANYATWIERVPGGLIDGLIVAAVYIGLYIAIAIISAGFGAVSETAGALVGCFGALVGFAAYFGAIFYNKVYLVSQRGSSIGQGVMGLKVVTAENSTPQVGTLVLRQVVQLALSFVPCIGPLLDFLWPLWDPQRQTLHDKAAGTYVVKAR